MDVKEVTCLAFFEYNINGDIFNRLFQEAGGSERMASHIWAKFTSHNHSFLRTFGLADSENRELLFKVATKWCEENDYPGKK